MFFSGEEEFQEYFFKMSILESSFYRDTDQYKISIDHYNGRNFLNEIEFPLIFPKYLIEKIKAMDKNKNNDYIFQGLVTEKRSWVYEYKNSGLILNKNYFFESKNRYDIDIEYYRNMCRSKFALCPTGNCPWSYRLFEAVLCHAIPIIDDDDDDIFVNYFTHYKRKERHYYDDDVVNENYKILIDKFTIDKYSF